MCDKIIYDYYWREYKGDIPFDAVQGGHDIKNKPTYIGQACIQKYGIIPVMIHPGEKSVVASIWGIRKTDKCIKILCSPYKENFKWIRTNKASFHVATINKHLVPGGLEGDLVTNIGRVAFQHELIVGKVCGKLGKAKMYFSSKTKEEKVDAFEKTMRDDYYWRVYTGDIPYDAVKGGYDVNQRTTYIGQVCIEKYGIIPVMIYPGEKFVVASVYGLHKTDKYVKILCSPYKENFKWLRTNATDFHMMSINKHLVSGGVEGNLVTNIGRVAYQRELVVGKICGNPGNAKMWFSGKAKEETVNSYEVLVFDPKRVWPFPGAS